MENTVIENGKARQVVSTIENADERSRARQIAQSKLDQIINSGRAKQYQVIQALQQEVEARKDYLVPRDRISFSGVQEGATSERLRLNLDGGSFVSFNDYSRSQIAEKFRVPNRYLGVLLDEDPIEAARHLNHVKDRHKSDRALVREVNGEVKGFLSDKYKPIDQGDVVAKFLQSVQEVGAVPQDGFLTDRRFILRAISPTILEPITDELIVMGIQVSSSDYGAGALSLKMFQIRMWCTNHCVGNEYLREVHMGGRLGDGTGLINWSEQTMDLNSRTALSAMQDTMRGILHPDNQAKIVDAWRVAAGEVVDVDKKLLSLRNQAILNKGQADQIKDIIANESRIEVLPQTPKKNSQLRFAQALSWLGQQADGEQRMLIEQAAGKEMRMPKAA